MTKEEVQELVEKGIFPGKASERSLIETHISRVILTDDFAFKLKKPLELHFLDFSSLEKRKASCEIECKLNRRLAADMYLGVLPVKAENGKWRVGEGPGKIVDYALWMKRLDPQRQMHLLLQKGEVRHAHIGQLARQLAAFHLKAEVYKPAFDVEKSKNEFNDLASVREFVGAKLGNRFADIIDEAVRKSDDFLASHAKLLAERLSSGFIRDVHGDLHAGNIFLLEKPVIFDCIEFNDAFRQIDLLNEIAFFCMDLEAHGREDLSQYFIQKYRDEMQQLPGLFHEALFAYYKGYRANVRAKVKALAAMQAEGEEQADLLREVKGYLQLLSLYPLT